MRAYLLLLTLIVVTSSLQVGAKAPSSTLPAEPAARQTSDAVIAQVEQAIEDEIYDYKREGLFFEIDGNGGGDNTPAVLSVHVSKQLTSDGVGIAVYDDMPYGQIYRYFSVGQDGVVKLSGDPQGPFRDWGGSVLTIYMKTEKVCEFIMNQSIAGSFTVDPNVSQERIHLSSERQLQRTGYSFRLDHRKGTVQSKQKLTH